MMPMAPKADLEVVRRLSKRARYNSSEAIRYAGFKDYKEFVELYAKIEKRVVDGESASYSVSLRTDEEMVGILFEGFANTFLEDALREGDAHVVQLLIENGVDINRVSLDSFLTTAVFSGQINMVKILLDEGADTNLKVRDNCWTPLRAAIRKRRKDIAQLLIEAGANVHDDKPIWDAVNHGHKELVELLLEKGANVNTRGTDLYGRSAFEIATSKGHKEIAELLLSHGAWVYTYGYCTQGCLLGLKRGSSLDENCPNVSLHRRGGDGVHHEINTKELSELMRAQLAEDLDHHCEPLGKQGARGALFKLTLASHGYTFVGKGTVKAFVTDIKNEGRVYQKLESIQGEAVPVYLGNIDLTEWYYLDLGVRILHMLLMSWGGDIAEEDETMKGASEQLKAETKRTVAEVRGAGIDQMDVRAPNLLWNRELRRVMLIDFERAAISSYMTESK